MNPHNWLTKVTYWEEWEDDPIWKCNYCGVEGTLEELGQIECSYKYALSDPGIYIEGGVK